MPMDLPIELTATTAGGRDVPDSAHLLALLDGVRAGIVTVDRGRVVQAANRRLGELLRIPAAEMTRAIRLADLLHGSAVLTETLAREVDAALRASIDDGRERTAAIVIGHGEEARFLALHVKPLADGTWALAFEDTTERHAAEARAIDSALRDPLTGLLNRRLFQVQAMAALEARQAHIVTDPVDVPSDAGGQAVLLIDLDRFKSVNDTLGHAVGDGLLGLVSKRLRGIARAGDVVARLGGDEFAILVATAADRAGLAGLAGRLVDVIGRPYLVDGHLINIGASIGLALAPKDGDTYDRLLRNADLALYDAKAGGRGTFRFFHAEMDDRAVARRSLEIDLRKALALSEFELVYQPQIDLDTRGVVGFEALLRWRHPTRGVVSPAEFIPLAEELGLIVPLGEWVLREACREAARWPDPVMVAVNVSPLQFEDLQRLLDAVARSLRNADLPGRRLEIEITEGALLSNEQGVLAALRQLRAMDVRVAMDDFGTGYSSLSQLRSFPFDKIKIDRSFVADTGDLASQNAFIRAINALGASLGMSTIAEGVETEEQLARIRAEGCTSVQGFLFSRPVGPDQIDRVLAGFAGDRTSVPPP